jgi:hypothetical protein
MGSLSAPPDAPPTRATRDNKSWFERAMISEEAVLVALATVCGSEPSTTSSRLAG